MKSLNHFIFFLLSSIIFLSSCRTEETIVIDPPVANTIQANSKIAALISKTALKDGSIDNIIDKANCLTVKFPVTVTVNGEKLVIEGEDGYDMIEKKFDAFKDDVDSVVITYPIKVIFSNYTIETINSDAELIELAKKCKGENEEDDDIECVDFKFPLKISYFNENVELVDIVEVENDNQLYSFIENIENLTVVAMNFPVKLIHADGAFIEVENIETLEEVLENADNSCDEDDDNDYNDDDCNECSIDKLKDLFDTQDEFRVDDLERNGVSQSDQYVDYLFSFGLDGTIEVFKAGTTFSGTWEASGTANEISFTINIPDLPDFNHTWRLNEIKTKSGEINIEFKKGDDELKFVKTL